MKARIACFVFTPALFAASLAAAGAVPSVSDVKMTQSPDRTVTITYALANGPAAVTLDIETNSPSGWFSIGASNIYSADFRGRPQGDVNRKVTGSTGVITWRPLVAWKDHGIPEARAVVTAWALDDTPPYMVVDMTAGVAAEDRVRYYQSADFLPGGGLLAAEAYRKTHLVLKKVLAKDVTWTMGSVEEYGRVAAREKSHAVTLTNNYYLGVFPVTQKQCSMMYGATWINAFPIDGEMRVRDRMYWHKYQPYVRGETFYPDAPTADSLLGKLRVMTGGVIDFDLPSEAQWEYAAKAGHGENDWGDGTPIMIGVTNYNYDATLPGRYRHNNATEWFRYDSGANAASDYSNYNGIQGPTNGTPVVGSYRPNSWGFYDMCGGIWEWCLDWYAEDITGLNGAVNANGMYLADGTTAGTHCVQRGGSWFASASACRPAFRGYATPTYPGDCVEGGFRVCCRAGLK